MAKFKDLYPAACGGAKSYLCASTLFDEFKNLLLNNVKITGLPYPVEARVKNVLIECGRVGYDRLTDKWTTVYGEGINELGNPIYGTFVFPNRSSYQRTLAYEPKADGAYIINAFESTFSMAEVIRNACRVMDECDKGIYQNLKACQTPLIVKVRDEDTRLSVEHAIQQKEDGAPAIVVDDTLGDALVGLETKAQFIADKYATYREMERDKLLNKLGIMSANINKRERVQVGEVNATVGQCSDYIYMLVDCFNKQMDTYGLPFKMELNGSLEELYTNGTEEEETEVNNNGNV